MSIPTMEYSDGLVWGAAFPLDTDIFRNQALILMRDSLLIRHWGGQRVMPRTVFTLDIPIVGSAGPFDLIITYYQGFAFRIFSSARGDHDPTGVILEGTGPNGTGESITIGVDISPYDDQNSIISKLAQAMENVSNGQWSYKVTPSDPFNLPGEDLDGVYSRLQVVLNFSGPADFQPQPALANGEYMTGQILGGGAFQGAPYGGGWNLTSPVALGGAGIGLKFTNTGNITLDTDIDGLSLPSFYIQNRRKVDIGIGTWTVIFIADYKETYVPQSIQEIISGGGDYWVTVIRPPDDQLNNRAVMVWADGTRNLLSTRGGCAISTGHGSWTYWEGAGALVPSTLPDTGIQIITINSMYTSPGPLLTTAGKEIRYSCLAGLSSHRDEAIEIWGYIYNCSVTTKYAPIDTFGMEGDIGPNGLRAYRSQLGPDEATLWILS